MASSLDLFSVAVALSSSSLSPISAPAMPRHLSPIVGKALRSLIAGSIVAELSDNGRAGAGEMYRADGIYQFLGTAAVSVRARYEIQQDRVCILGDPEQLCFAYFKDRRGGYRRLKLQLSDGVYRAITVKPISETTITK